VELKPARFSEPVRARLPEAWGDRDDRRANVALDDLELVPLPSPAVGQIARGDDELGAEPPHEAREGRLDLPILACTRVKIGYVQEAYRHDRMRLYIHER